MNSIALTRVTSMLLCLFGLPACGQQTIPEDFERTVSTDGRQVELITPADSRGKEAMNTRIRAALKQLDPNLVPEYIGPASAPGYQEVIIKGQVVFVTDDGHFLVQGLTDLRNKRDVGQLGALPGWRLQILNEIPTSERIVFAPDGPIKHTVSIFTDVECGFCRKLHQEIGEYNKLGIAIEYLAFPRTGLESPDAAIMESIWCSKDRRTMLTKAKNGMIIPPLKCDNPVAKHHDIGERIGLQGTPMIINADGVALRGYLPPDKLSQTLDEMSAQHGPNASGEVATQD